LLEVVLVGVKEENMMGRAETVPMLSTTVGRRVGMLTVASDDVAAATDFSVVTAAPEVAEGLALQDHLVLVLFMYGAPEVWENIPSDEEAVIAATGEEGLAMLEAVAIAAAPEEVITAV
jgi:hypothetical protein